MRTFDFFIIASSLACMVLGLMLSFWPLVPAGIALLVLYGHTAIGVTAGLFFDIVYGAPVGILSMLHFPFLLFAVLCVALRIASIRFVLPRDDLGTL